MCEETPIAQQYDVTDWWWPLPLNKKYFERRTDQEKQVDGPDITADDGELLDKHDSFYMTTKSLLVLFQITGVMPIMRVPKCEASE